MESLFYLIKEHNNLDKTRSSFSNLIKKIKLEKELCDFIESYIDFGTFKQKLYHIMNSLPKSKMMCSICGKNELSWVDNKNSYRNVCSKKCAGKLTGKKNTHKKNTHPILGKKEEFIEYFRKGRLKLTEGSLSKIYPDLTKSINLNLKFQTDLYSEKVYFYLYELKNIPLCKNCNYNPVKFDTFSKGYHSFCSVKCSSNSEEKKDRIKNTCIEKYGVNNISSVTRNKALETMNTKYGMHVSKTKEHQDKIKNTCIEKHGVEYSFKSEKVKEKIKKNLLEKYNVDNPMKNKEIMQRGLNTKKDKGLVYKWSESELDDIQSYRRSVSYYTEKTYEEYKDIINPKCLQRGIHDNHIDHIFPVIEGWKNKIHPKLISHHLNLRLVNSYDNLSKGDRTDITLDDFFKMINS